MITTASAAGRHPPPDAASTDLIASEAAAAAAPVVEQERSLKEGDRSAAGAPKDPAPSAADANVRLVAEREQDLQNRITEKAASAAPTRAAAPEDQEMIEPEFIPPPAAESLVKGGMQSRLEAKAEVFEAEARLRIFRAATTGYATARSALQ